MVKWNELIIALKDIIHKNEQNQDLLYFNITDYLQCLYLNRCHL